MRVSSCQGLFAALPSRWPFTSYTHTQPPVAPLSVTKTFHPSVTSPVGLLLAAFRANELIMSDREKAVKYLLEFYKDVGIDGDETKARYTLGYRDYQTLDQALADLKSGATEKALTDTAQVFVAGGAYDKVPDLKGAVAAALPIVEAAKALRK